MKKKNRIILNVCCSAIIFIILVIIQYQTNIGNIYLNLKYATLIGVAINVSCIVSAINVEKNISSPYILFQILSLVFLYGQLICRELLNFYVKQMFDLSVLVTYEGLVEACFLIMYNQLALHIGFLLTKKDVEKKENIYNSIIEKKTLKKVGIILLIISIIPTMFLFVRNFKYTSVSGYSGLTENTTYGFASICNKIVPYFQIALFMLMVAEKENSKKSKLILLFSILFYGIQMFFGNRGIPLIAVITSIWLYNKAVKKINMRKMCFIIVLIIPLTSIINIIRTTRDDYGFEKWISNAGELVWENLTTSNSVLEACYEMGTAIYPTAFTVENVPQKFNYKYGKTYLLSILSIVTIDTSGSKNDLAYTMNIASQISKEAGAPFGGSYIQEAYANFGWFSPLIFSVFFGYLFGVLERKIKSSSNLISIVLIAYFLNPLLWTVRNVTVTLPREIAWYIVPSYIFYKLIYNSYKRGKYEKG